PLVAFAHGGTWPPLQRLRTLLNRRSFVGLEDIIGRASLDVDSAAVHRHFDELMRSRKKGDPGSSLIDAQALEEIRAANRELKARNERIHLVTRSTNVARVADAASAADSTPR